MNWKRRAPDARTLFLALMALMAVTSVVGAGLGAAASAQTEQARLTIEQPRHVSDSVDYTTENGTRVYTARGKYLEIEPNNFNQSAVTSFGVQEAEGVLTYDKSDREYVLNTQGNPGTYHLSWTVSEDNTTTVYTAKIRVVTADYSHVPSEQYTQLKEDAERGDSIISRFEGAGDEDKPVDQKVDFAIQVIEFTNNPFSALTGGFIAIQTLRFMTPAGWLDLGLTVLLVYALTRGLYSTIARLRKQLEKEEQVSRREDVQYLKMVRQFLGGEMMTDVDAIDDHQAAALEQKLGSNLYTALHNFWNVWGADNLKRMYADAMGAVGYHTRVHRDAGGNVTSVDVLDPDSREPMADGGEGGDESHHSEVISLSNASDDVVDAMTWEQVDGRVFERDPDISMVDHLMVANRNADGDLIGKMNVSVPEDFQSRREFMDAIARFYEHVMKSDFTDEENVPRESRAFLNQITVFTRTLDDEYGIPLDLWWRAAIWNAEGLDRDDEAESVLSDITDGGNALSDIDLSTGGGDSSGAD